jgi:hypothetical protein
LEGHNQYQLGQPDRREAVLLGSLRASRSSGRLPRTLGAEKDITMPAKELLDREKIDTFVRDKLTAPISLLRELVDYGVNLIDRCAQVGGSLSDLIVIGHFFKHSVAMLDSVEILLSRGAVFAAGVSARSMLEAYMYLEWLLNANTDDRARHFYVWHLRQKREWARRAIPGTAENTIFQPYLNSLSVMNDPVKSTAIEAEGRKQDADLTTILTNANNRPINDQFANMKRRTFDVNWYKPTGAQSIGDIAKKLSLESEYRFFYSEFSDITHAGAFDKNVTFDGEAVIFEPIRNPEGIDTVVNVVATLAFRVFRLIIKKYFPAEIEAFNQNYINQWRSRFLSVPKVQITASKK